MRHLLSIFACLVLSGLPLAAQETPRPAKVFTVAAQSAEISRRYPGIVLPSQELNLSFRISGNLVELPIRASQPVVAGDVIAQLDIRDLKTQAAQLQSAIDQAQAQLDALQAGARTQEVAALQANVDAAQAQLDQAEENVERSRALAQRGTVSQAVLDQDEAALRVAQSQLRAQEEQLSLTREGARAEDIASAEASVRGLQAQLQAVTDSISDATLRAPFDGIIARREVENFTNIQAGQTIALLQALSTIHVSFDVPAPDVTVLAARGPDSITNRVMLEALPGMTFAAETVEFSVQAETGTQTYRGRVAVDMPQEATILPGMVGTVISSAMGPVPKLKVPLTAVVAAADGSAKVWIVDASAQVSEREVSLGEVFGAEVEVLEGLASGDRIVAAGVTSLVPGMTVRPVTKIGG
ncbi:MAG: efflux RND transporter periplasmic adaptor subunit [Pseudomonadota bacterium]